ncbi:MAG TPA: glycine cleavage T C-terminal barrel domain-containing protein [Planctomycetota bacterium]|nr:glycine cleavage T C-terminal barrel domain-containing protein [Planctomycetota bacterium]
MDELASLLARLGGRIADGPDPGVPADFGDPASEVAAAETALAAGPIPWRGLVRVGGAEAVPFLQRLLSCDLGALSPGESAAGCLLTPAGRAVAVVLALRAEAEVLLEVEAALAPALLAALERYRFAEPVELADRTSETAWLALLGPKGGEALRSVGIADAPSAGRHAATSEGSVRVLRTDALGIPDFRLLAPRRRAAPLLERVLASVPGARPIGAVPLEYLRIRAGIPRQGLDLDEATYPDEVGLEASLSTSKGCYPGQEVVARLRTYGGARRRLVVLRFEPGPPPRSGDRIERDGVEVGRVTSVSAEGALGPFLALGLARREGATEGAAVEIRRGSSALRAVLVAPSPTATPRRG